MSGSTQPPPTATATVASGAAGVFPVAFGYYPQEGSRCVSAQYNWLSSFTFNEDLSQLVARGVETVIQSIFVDNSSVSQPIQIVINGTDQVIECPAWSQGVFPAFFTGTPGYSISIAAGGNQGFANIVPVTRLYLLNVPANAASIWSAPPPGSLMALAPPGQLGGLFTSLGITSSNSVTAGVLNQVGRVAKIVVNATTAVGTITINDAQTTGTVTAANTILTIPIGAPAGTIYTLDMPFFNGLAVNFNGGATGTISVSYQT
jgi:hypothetical protein